MTPASKYQKNYIATHPKYKAWRKAYITEYMRKYRLENKDYLNARRRGLRAIRKATNGI